MVLCKLCQTFDLRSIKAKRRGSLDYRIDYVCRSGEEGCEFCRFLHEIAAEYCRGQVAYELIRLSPEEGHLGIQRINKGKVEEWIQKAITTKTPFYNRLLMTLAKPKPLFGGKEEKLELELCIAAEEEESASVQSGTVGRIYLGRDRLSSRYLTFLQRTLDNCAFNHCTCCRTISDATQTYQVHALKLPTRCIEVYPDSGCFLRYTAGLIGCYITLSHRWTRFSKACRTTAANYEERIAGQDLENRLSGHFQNAFELARGLGVQYVWIDSICIIQETQDVRREMANMGQYYQLSYFTIAAVNSSEEVDEGFLAMRGADPIKSMVHMPYLEKGVQKGSLCIYRRELTADAQFLRDVDRSELLTRGWVFQEWLLARRILYFGACETFFECAKQGVASLSFDKLSRRDVVSLASMDDKFWFHGGESAFVDAYQNNTLVTYGFKSDGEHKWADWPLDEWFLVTQKYSTTSVTVPDDRFFAISAVAGEFLTLVKRKYGSEQRADLPTYLSGIWQQDICRGLMWISRHPASSVKECNGLAPTWSWMSLDSPVAWIGRVWHARNRQDKDPQDFRPQKAIEIVGVGTGSAHTSVEDSLPNSNVSEVLTPVIRLTIRAKLQYLVTSGRMSDMTRMGQLTGFRYVIHYGRPNDFFCVSSLDNPRGSGGWGKFERIEPLAPPYCALESATPLIALLIATREWAGIDYEDHTSLFRHGALDTYEVLFVQPVNLRDDIYKRVGAGIVFDRHIQKAFDQTLPTEITLI